jgi:hypothetical protein
MDSTRVERMPSSRSKSIAELRLALKGLHVEHRRGIYRLASESNDSQL